jgi:hypothetical protein
MDTLENLRFNLRHFQNTPHFGDPETVEAICKHLELRIRQTEGWVRMIEAEQIISKTQLQARAA